MTITQVSSSVELARQLADLTRRVTALERTGTADTGWITVDAPLAAGWTGTVSFRKIGKVVHLRGVLSGGAAGQAPFFLPEGYRPGIDQYFDSWSSGNARTKVRTDGAVYIDSGTAATWVLDGINFPADG